MNETQSKERTTTKRKKKTADDSLFLDSVTVKVLDKGAVVIIRYKNTAIGEACLYTYKRIGVDSIGNEWRVGQVVEKEIKKEATRRKKLGLEV